MPCGDWEATGPRALQPEVEGRTRGNTPDPQRHHRHTADNAPSSRPRLRTVVDERSATARTEPCSHQQGCTAGADRPALTSKPTRALQKRVDLARPCLDRHELGAPLDDERLVEVVAAIHLEREPTEFPESLVAEDEQRPPLAAKIARSRSGRLAGEERHGERIAGREVATGSAWRCGRDSPYSPTPPTWTYLTSRYSSIPTAPPSRP